MIAHINIGSNTGDSRSMLERAVAAVFSLHEPARDREGADTAPRRSAVVESEPWGFESANRFLNTGVEINTTLAPLELLDRLQGIERSIAPGSPHRNADGSYRDRALDIDLIFLGDNAMDTPRLTLPHPRWQARAFVTGPVRELGTFLHMLTATTQ